MGWDTHRDESSDLLSVLDQLDTDTLADSRVGLLGLNTDFFEDDALGVGGASSGGRLVDVSEGTLLVLLIGLIIEQRCQGARRHAKIATDPSVLLAVEPELAGGLQSTRLVGYAGSAFVDCVEQRRRTAHCCWRWRGGDAQEKSLTMPRLCLPLFALLPNPEGVPKREEPCSRATVQLVRGRPASSCAMLDVARGVRGVDGERGGVLVAASNRNVKR
jgi:hypothetical protein